MKAIRVCVVMVLVWCMQTGVSYAYVDWWDHLSGPGPFWGFVIPYRFLCVSKGSDQAAFRTGTRAGESDQTFTTWIGPLDSASILIPMNPVPIGAGTNAQEQARIDCLRDERLRSYALVSNTYFWSTSNRLFPADPENPLYGVRIMHVELSYAIRLHETLDISAAVGLSRYSGDVFDPIWRPSLTPVVVHFAPFAFKWPNQWGRSFKLSAGLITSFDGFDAADFCNVDPVTCAGVDPTFKSEKERVYRLGIEFNPVLLKKLF